MMKFNTVSFLVMSSLLLFSSTLFLMSFMMLISGKEWVLEWEAFSLGGASIIFLLVMDFMSALFLSTVMMIAGGVFFYSSSYMSGEKYSSRFSLLVMSFVVSMIILIISPNLVSLLLGWDGLGVTSYLLVCYYSSEKSFNASMLTALTNRLGDVAILLSIAVWWSAGMMNYGLLSSGSLVELNSLFWVVIIAAMTKSAQIPFSAWLPAAMAAPTPVSALVHSSTLVTAGVYLLIRFNYVITMSGYINIVLFLGMITMTMAGGSALMELDMKKIIALSTLSQLGVMFFSLGMGQPFLAFFHLVSHAYFKAMLFMAAGAMIHSVKDYQDLRKMGGFASSLYSISMVMLVSNLSLCGLPFMSGFYSKDLILEMLIMMDVNIITMVVAMLATMLTMAYSCRFAVMMFLMSSKRDSFSSEADTDNTMLVGMSVLIIPSIMGGWWLSGLMPSNYLILLPLWKKMWILMMILITGLVMIIYSPAISPSSMIIRAFHMMWFLPKFISPYLTFKSMKFTKNYYKTSDVSWISMTTWGWLYNYKVNFNYNSSSLRMGVMMSLINILLISMI
uniref:NADH dehydrogenase subunit 5 n=1 Tax=Labidocera rotunda TaxID=207950 RepID=UPI0020369C98|nr:NADH dehydrogenase subunit 5 [Labidocera rotunda]URC16609.1 NADH dehydrogenase subunit 5 [Labidocera rotunda]